MKRNGDKVVLMMFNKLMSSDVCSDLNKRKALGDNSEGLLILVQ